MSWFVIEQKRRVIEERQFELRQQIAVREAELKNLEVEWDETCLEADQILNCALLRRQAL